MGKELTVPQLLLLADISERPETVSDHYRPAKALIERGYATAQRSAYGSLVLSITSDGLAALKSRGACGKPRHEELRR